MFTVFGLEFMVFMVFGVGFSLGTVLVFRVFVGVYSVWVCVYGVRVWV